VSRPSSGGGSSYIDQATDPNQPGGSGSLQANFIATIKRQKKFVTDFQAGWQKIQGAAETALARCGTNGNPNPQKILDRAALMLIKATDALAALEEIEAEIAAASDAPGVQTEKFYELAQQYQALVSSGTLPSADEISEAKIESQDTGDVEPGSLYSQLTRLNSPGACAASGT